MGHAGLIWRGGIYQVQFGKPVGHEAGYWRPAVVVSADIVNQGPGLLVMVVPVTTVGYGLRSHVEVEASTSGLDHDSYARCDQLRAVSAERLGKRLGQVPIDTMRSIEQALRFLLEL